jgi:hypothetical protein
MILNREVRNDNRPEPAGTERGTERVEAFSDCVFAIAITLLILDVKVPHFLERVSACRGNCFTPGRPILRWSSANTQIGRARHEA